jgi:hypothetical protein
MYFDFNVSWFANTEYYSDFTLPESQFELLLGNLKVSVYLLITLLIY